MRKKKVNGGLCYYFKRNDVINEVEEKKKVCMFLDFDSVIYKIFWWFDNFLLEI